MELLTRRWSAALPRLTLLVLPGMLHGFGELLGR
jgi:hypothetical protein